MAKKSKIIKSTIFWSLLLIAMVVGYWVYLNVFKSNVRLNGKKYTYIYIKSNATFNDVLDELEDIIDNRKTFEWTAKEMKLQNNIIAGKYRVDASMSNRSIINMLIKGKQEKIKLTFNSQIRTKEQFINYVSDKLEIEKSELEDYCEDTDVLKEKYNLTTENFMTLIMPTTYEVTWATPISDLFNLIKKTYDNYWTANKTAKVKEIELTIPEVVTLASIVQSESSIKSEQQKIAGVYLNRLKKDMKLQADPTVVFANKNFSAQRVLSADKQTDSPYNTYMYKGLPPGPICLVSASTIDAVLNYTKHNYIYFCAKPDFSGLSSFTSNYKEHMKNALAYQEALNQKGIKR